jgi:hypothetical protein
VEDGERGVGYGAERMKSSGPMTVASLVVVAGLVGVALAAGEEIPALKGTWETISSATASLFSHGEVSSTETIDADAMKRDGGSPLRKQTAPLSSAQLSAPIAHGPFVSACGATDDMKVVVTLAVKMGRATEILVKTVPPNPVVESCVERAVRDLRWDISPNTGHVTVTY